MTINRREFGTLPDGRPVQEYSLSHGGGLTVDILTFGAIIRRIMALDTAGTLENCILGFDTLEGYLADAAYQGRVIGRVAGRISSSAFSVGGERFQLTPNEGGNHLHGGPHGFHQILWEAETGMNEDGQEYLVLSHTSPDGTGGYPGALKTQLTFCLTNDQTLSMSMICETDRATPVSLTRHEYFNLGGSGKTPILDHHLQVPASRFVPFSDDLTPAGTVENVQGTELDLRSGTLLEDRFTAFPAELAAGYDHYLVLEGPADTLREVARLSAAATGRELVVRSNQPGLVLYTGGYLPEKFAGLCLEPQGYPDAANQPGFPSNILHPGGTYRHDLSYSFSCTSR